MSIINLLPEDYLKRRMQQRANVTCSVLFGLVMAGVLGAAFVSDQSIRHTRQVSRRISASYAEAAGRIEQMNQLMTQRQAMLRKAETTASLLERIPRSTVLAVVTNAVPAHMSLTAVNMTTQTLITRGEGGKSKGKGKPSTDALASLRSENLHETSTIMEATGLAGTDLDVARFIANLAANPLMRSVDLVFSQEELVATVACRKFQVRMELNIQAEPSAVVAKTLIDRAQANQTDLTDTMLGANL